MIHVFNYGKTLEPNDCIEDMLDSLIPIELPSDEEIWEKIEDFPYSIDYDTGFMQGAKWVIELIKKQCNEK